MRKILPILIIFSCLGIALYILWQEEFKHYLRVEHQPTLAVDSKVDLSFISFKLERPVYLHFFSEECLNARINIHHIAQITDNYKKELDFLIINQSTLSANSFRRKYGLPDYLKIISDEDGEISNSLNIATTPYSMILNMDSTLYFSGNYTNQNGLCGPMDIQWSAPAIALKFLVKKNNPPLFPEFQSSFRGCQIN